LCSQATGKWGGARTLARIMAKERKKKKKARDVGPLLRSQHTKSPTLVPPINPPTRKNSAGDGKSERGLDRWYSLSILQITPSLGNVMHSGHLREKKKHQRRLGSEKRGKRRTLRGMWKGITLRDNNHRRWGKGLWYSEILRYLSGKLKQAVVGVREGKKKKVDTALTLKEDNNGREKLAGIDHR